jgi:hypothetical protein
MPRNKREEVPELTTGTSFAANEAFTASSVSANGLDRRRSERRSGWDPYEVWRTRVKTATRAKQVRGEKFVRSGPRPTEKAFHSR